MSDSTTTVPQTTPPPIPNVTPAEASDLLLNDALLAPIRDIVETAGITRKCETPSTT